MSSSTEQTPLLPSDESPAPRSVPSPEGGTIDSTVAGQSDPQGGVQSAITWRLYVSHFLSTWNARAFEFGAVLFLASIFPGTLLPMSVYALTRGVSAIVLSPAVGRYIDTGERLQVVRLSIGRSQDLEQNWKSPNNPLIQLYRELRWLYHVSFLVPLLLGGQ